MCMYPQIRTLSEFYLRRITILGRGVLVLQSMSAVKDMSIVRSVHYTYVRTYM